MSSKAKGKRGRKGKDKEKKDKDVQVEKTPPPEPEGEEEEEVLYQDEGGVGEGDGGKEESEDEGKEQKGNGKKRKAEEQLESLLGLLARAVPSEDKDHGLSSRAISGLQISWLKNLQPFNPNRDDLATWCSMVKELIPPRTAPEVALRLVMTRLPRTLSDMLRMCFHRVKDTDELSWDSCINLFLARVIGTVGKLTKEKRAQKIKQREGEGVRAFAIRTTAELQAIYGRSPTEEEWKRAVMMGAREATALEMDKVESTTGETDLWRLIEVAEIHERQNQALLSLPDGDRLGGALPPSERPKDSDSDVLLVSKGVSEETCGWCSKIGHKESTCRRQNPICGECGGEHVTRRHAEVNQRERKLREVAVQAASSQTPQGDEKDSKEEPRRPRDIREESSQYPPDRGDIRDWRGGMRGRGGWRGRGGEFRGRGSWRGRPLSARGGRGYPPASSDWLPRWRQSDPRDVRSSGGRSEVERRGCHICHNPNHYRRECPHTVCFSCGKKGHERRACDQFRNLPSLELGNEERFAQALVVESGRSLQRDSGGLAQQLREDRKEVLGRLDELGRQITQQRPATSVPSEKGASVMSESNEMIPDRPRQPGLEGLLDGIASEIR